jgi:SAM-dependent methyltransferase
MRDLRAPTTPYGTLAAVYEWLQPDTVLEPAGSAAAFDTVVSQLPPGARVLDCASGTGELAVGLALRGFDVVASDASPAMVERTRALTARHGVAVPASVVAWEDLDRQGWDARFDAVFCVGNSLAHAEGRAGRRAALWAMSTVVREGGLVAITSRNWEQVRGEGPGLRVADRLVERGARSGLVVQGWTVPDGWDEPHLLDVAVAFLGDDGAVTTHGERLAFWPFTHEGLDDDLHAAGLVPASSTYAPDAERYLVIARTG